MKFVSTRNLVTLVTVGCFSLVALLLIGRDVPAAVVKLVTSSGFIVLAIQVGGLRSNYGRIILLGLTFSWLGDAALIGEALVTDRDPTGKLMELRGVEPATREDK